MPPLNMNVTDFLIIYIVFDPDVNMPQDNYMPRLIGRMTY